ncbi:MAG: Lrp/AsnC family transcriptional regulator [Candidatus Marinimicrobia bacterium]|nr:Lrp/AsnC family transcriptional regulator [Candidatus Neomarinimicrobiota bacterium]
MNLDKIDKKILETLQEDGRIKNSDLAKLINISPPPTAERVKKLEKNGYVKKYVALVDPIKVGITCFTYVEVTLVRHGKDAIERFMSSIVKLDEVMECHHITGGADFLLKIATKDIPTYEQFIIQTLTALPDVQHLKTLVVLSTLKHETKISIGD